MGPEVSKQRKFLNYPYNTLSGVDVMAPIVEDNATCQQIFPTLRAQLVHRRLGTGAGDLHRGTGPDVHTKVGWVYLQCTCYLHCSDPQLKLYDMFLQILID